MNMRTLISILAFVLSAAAHSAPLPYNETADAKLGYGVTGINMANNLGAVQPPPAPCGP